MISGLLIVMGFLICFSSSVSSAAESVSRYPWIMKKTTVICSLFPKERSMSVEGEIIFNKVASYSEFLSFDLSPANLKLIDGSGKNIPYEYYKDGGICLKSPLPYGMNTIRFEFQHSFPASDSADPYLFVGEDFTNLEFGSCWYPRIGLCISIDGKYVLPANHMAELAISAPKGYTVIGAGKKIGEKCHAGRVTSYFRTEKPVFSLEIYAGKYKTIQGSSAGINFSIHVRKGLDFKRASETKENVAKILQFYVDRYGFFPFSELDIIQRPYLPNGNNYSTTHGRVLINGEDVFTKSPEEMSPAPASLLAHEIYHQYICQMVRGTGFDRKLFTEGMTCYGEILCANSILESSLMSKAIDLWALILRKIPEATDVAIASLTKENPNLSRYAYYKMPLFLLTLRHCVGDAVMKKVELSLLKKYGFKDPITFNEFLSTLKQNTGSLPGANQIFDAWLNKPGLPPFWKPDLENVIAPAH